MRIFMFRSDKHGLSAFTGDAEGRQLPPQFAPWVADGVVEPGRKLPHNIFRPTIESAVKIQGFQLWRTRKRSTEDA